MSYHLFSFCRSVQDCIIHMDMEIVIFLREPRDNRVYYKKMLVIAARVKEIFQVVFRVFYGIVAGK